MVDQVRRRLGAPCCPHPYPLQPKDPRKIRRKWFQSRLHHLLHKVVATEMSFRRRHFRSLPRTTLMSPMKKTVRTAVSYQQSRFTAGKRRSRTKDLSLSGREKSSSTVRLQCGKTISRGRNKCLSKSEEAARLMHTRGSPSQLHPLPPRLRQRRQWPMHYTSSSRELSLLLPSECCRVSRS